MGRALEVGGFAALLLPAAYLYTRVGDAGVQAQLLFCAAVAVCAFFTTATVVPNMAAYFSRKGLKGRDLGRRGTPQADVEM